LPFQGLVYTQFRHPKSEMFFLESTDFGTNELNCTFTQIVIVLTKQTGASRSFLILGHRCVRGLDTHIVSSDKNKLYLDHPRK